MMEKYYCFGGIELAVQIPQAYMYREELQLAAFRVEQVQEPHLYRARVVPALEPPAGQELARLPGGRVYAADGGYVRYHGAGDRDAGQAFMRAEHRGRFHEITLRADMISDRISARLVLNGLDVEHLAATVGGVVLHGSCIRREDSAVVFTAPSGTGKSTQAALWRTHRGAEIINGDRILLRPEKGRIHAAGLPFSGSSRDCRNTMLPLAAVVYLKQAPVNMLRRLRGAEAFRRIWEGCSVNAWNRGDVEAAAGLVESLLGQTAVYELACTPDESAVAALEQQLKKQEGL